MMEPKVTFGMIVLNGEPFIRYNLRSLYPFAHQIIVVEGAVPAARNVSTSDGHSRDTTIHTINKFKDEEDPDNKVLLLTAEEEGYPDGFWPGEKIEMSQAYAKRITGNILWQIDVDEFYIPSDMERVIKLFENNENIHAASFTTLYFWGGISYIIDGFAFRTTDHIIHRVFRWREGFKYLSHRPPTVGNKEGIDLRSLGWLSNIDTYNMGVYMYHYDMLLPIQAENKSEYYSNVDWHSLKNRRIKEWKNKVYDQLMTPFHIYTVYTHFSWLKPFKGNHPPIILEMIEDLKKGKLQGISLRGRDDIDRMLESKKFRYLLPIVKIIVIIQIYLYKIKMSLRKILLETNVWPIIQKIRCRGENG